MVRHFLKLTCFGGVLLILASPHSSALAAPAELIVSDTGPGGETYSVTGAQHWVTVIVGDGDGESGELIIDTGTSLSSGLVGGYNTIIGKLSGSSGSVYVQGAGALWTDISEAINVGDSGTGSIEISDGGSLNAYALNLGFSGGGIGSVLVTGEGSSLTTTMGVMSGVGAAASGSMTVQDGASFSTSGGGYYVESGSTVTVDGAGTSFRVGTLHSGIPDSWGDADGWFSVSAGTVNVSGGAFFETDGLYIQGHASDGDAVMSVTGEDTVLDAKLLIYVGGNGNGTAGNGELSITDGATATASVVSTGTDTGTVGKLVLSGEGTSLTTVPHGTYLGNVYAGTSGSGTIVVQDGAELVATNELRIAYSTGSQGSLVIGAEEGEAAVAPGLVSVANGIVFGAGVGEIVLNHTSDYLDFYTDISGAGDIRQIAGVTDLTGDLSGFIGSMSLIGGELKISGSLGGSTTVQSGGKLSGNGTVQEVLAQSGSIVAPGNSPGTLTVLGNYHQNAGSTYDVELVPGSTVSDLVDIGGSATIDDGAVLNVSKYGTGAYSVDANYLVLTAAGGVTGSYNLTGDLAVSTFYALQAQYDANNVYLRAVQSRLFADAALTVNQRATANALQSMALNQNLRNAVSAAESDAVARDAFDQLSGDVYPTIAHAIVEDSAPVRQAILRRLGKNDHFVWIAGLGSFGNVGFDGNVAGFSSDLGGVIGGVDAELSEFFRAGVFGAYTYTSINGDREASASVDTIWAGAYGALQWDAASLRFGAAYGLNDIATRRNVSFSGFSDKLSADYDGESLQVFAEAGYRIDLKPIGVEPFIGLAYTGVRSGGVAESGGAAALAVSAAHFETSKSTIGVHLTGDIPVSGANVSANATVAWNHILGDDVAGSSASFANVSAFETLGAQLSRDELVVEAGIVAELAPAVSLALDYNGAFASGSTRHGGRMLLNVKF